MRVIVLVILLSLPSTVLAGEVRDREGYNLQSGSGKITSYGIYKHYEAQDEVQSQEDEDASEWMDEEGSSFTGEEESTQEQTW